MCENPAHEPSSGGAMPPPQRRRSIHCLRSRELSRAPEPHIHPSGAPTGRKNYAPQAKDGQLIEHATDICLRASGGPVSCSSRLGDSGERARGGCDLRKELQPATLHDPGVTKTRSCRWQNLADACVSPVLADLSCLLNHLARLDALLAELPTSPRGFPRATGRARPPRSTFLVFRSLDPRSFLLRRAALPAEPRRHS